MSQGITNFFAGGWWEHRFPLHDITVPRPSFALKKLIPLKLSPHLNSRLLLFSAYIIKAATLVGATRLPWCRAASPPSLLRLASRTDCRKVHSATSGLYLHLIFIPHLAISSSSSSFSIHHPFSSLQSPLLFPICAFSPEERCSRRAGAE